MSATYLKATLNKLEEHKDEFTMEMAEASDFDEILDLIFYAPYIDSSLPRPETMNTESIIIVVAESMVNHPTFIHRDEDGKIVGFMLLKEHDKWWWSSEKILSNLYVFLKPEYRNKGLLGSFLANVEKYAIIKDVPFAFGLGGISDLSVKEDLISKYGYTNRIESHYTK
jgi:predicted acetyltransferase